jgi:metallophosphoesterase (TIGR00282 family)
LGHYKAQLGIDCVVANAENAAGGNGLTAAIAHELHASGVDAITLGDHVWDQRGFERAIADLPFVCRPANLPAAAPGRRYVVVEKNGFRLAVMSVLGRQFMSMRSTCPFACADALLAELQDGYRPGVHAVLVEVHAEATSEKMALGWYLAGRVTAVVGTHTHIQTADARLLQQHTAYLTDLGMTGAHDSVLGRCIEPVLGAFLDGLPRRFDVAHGNVRLCGCLIDIDTGSGAAQAIQLVDWPQPTAPLPA